MQLAVVVLCAAPGAGEEKPESAQLSMMARIHVPKGQVLEGMRPFHVIFTLTNQQTNATRLRTFRFQGEERYFRGHGLPTETVTGAYVDEMVFEVYRDGVFVSSESAPVLVGCDLEPAASIAFGLTFEAPSTGFYDFVFKGRSAREIGVVDGTEQIFDFDERSGTFKTSFAENLVMADDLPVVILKGVTVGPSGEPWERPRPAAPSGRSSLNELRDRLRRREE